jgi:hypothetical protein
MQYSEKLKDPKWIEFREKVKAKDGYGCVNNCGWKTKDMRLHVHHKIYYVDDGKFVEPWDYPLYDVETLCKTCHKAYHNTFTPPIMDRKTNKIINEDEPTRRTRLAIKSMKEKELENESK